MGSTESKEKYCINGKEVDVDTYKSKQIDGIYQSWFDNGTPDEKITYISGVPVGLYQKWYNVHGLKLIECTYNAGELNGLYTKWHLNRKKREECTYVNGKIHGLYQSFHSNGNIYVQCTYNAGEIDGPCTVWYADGVLSAEYMYNNGNRVESTIYHTNGQKEKKTINTQPFKRYVEAQVKDLASKESLQCGICYEDIKDKVVVFSCCSFTLCDSEGCCRKFEFCPQCRSEKPQTMLVALG